MVHPASDTDRLDAALLLLKALIIIFVFALVLLILSARFQNIVINGGSGALLSALNLTAPAIVPSGRQARCPETIDVRVNPDFSPFLFLPDPDPLRMVIRGTGRSVKPPSNM